MNYHEIDNLKKLFFEYFNKEYGHEILSGASLVPTEDDSVLFTPAGMHPLIPYLAGAKKHPLGNKLTSVQGVVRTGQIDKVGEGAFFTFFESFGVWELNNYSKSETLKKVWNFFTSNNFLGIPDNKISVTYFAGTNRVAEDFETKKLWKKIGIPDEHIVPSEKNWKGPYSSFKICGPNTRLFYDTGKSKCSQNCSPMCNCGKYVELWDIVFFDYILDDDELKLSPNPCVDMGAGVERIAQFIQSADTIYDTNDFREIATLVKKMQNKNIEQVGDEILKKIRIIADHIRCACFIIADETVTLPSNKGRGYVLRKIIRRIINNCNELNIDFLNSYMLIDKIIEIYEKNYPKLREKKEYIYKVLVAEYNIYALTLTKNILKIEKILKKTNVITTDEIYYLFNTYGIPVDTIKKEAQKMKVLIKEK